MTISVEEFAAKYDGKAVDFDKKYGAQCVDLFNYYNKEVVGAPWIGTPATGGARDLYEVASPARQEYYKLIGPDEVVQAGDVEVAGAPNGRYVEGGKTVFLGHVRIALGGGRYIEQNGKVSQSTAITTAKLSGKLGVLRPLKFIGQNSPQNVEPPTQNKNKHTISQGETFWGIEELKGWPHGTLQKLNPELDPKRLGIGQQINVPDEPVAAPSAAETYYTIQQGDTFYGLEDAWQLPHGTLQQLNPGVNPRTLQIGSKIRRS